MDIKGLLGSKSIVMVVAVVGACAMNVAGRVDGDKTLEFIKWIVMAWLGAEAWEAGKVKAAEKAAAATLIAAPDVETKPALDDLRKV